ncbi:hypothetical protein AaE_012926, partial [Aphanomyces astaci]
MAPGRRDLTNDEREAILRETLLKSNGSYASRLPKGFGPYLASKYQCNVSCIRKILARAKDQGVATGNMQVSVANKKKGKVGRKHAFTAAEVKAKLLQVPLANRTTLRSISAHTGISRGSLHRYLKAGMFRAHSNAIRPTLTDANKYNRMKFALGFVQHDMEFDELLDYVHIEEKWFYITKTTRRYYLVPGEREPERKCKNKRFVTKVMFLTAVARPRFNEDTQKWWDGKIGASPFIETVLAQRSSTNRAAGTSETKPVTVTKDVYRAYLVYKVLPSIVRRWPSTDRKIKLQHDNAKAHVTHTDAKLRVTFEEYRRHGWSFELAPQPPNSPDTNILDLGFFAAIQALQH